MKSLRSKLMVGVCAVVVGSALMLSALVAHWYGRNLHSSLKARALSLAHAASLEAAEMILINDLVALQKLLENQVKTNPSISYIFVRKGGGVPAHTFARGVPVGLIRANAPAGAEEGRAVELRSKAGERFIDVAWPIFGGRAGVLRLGVSEKPFEEQVRTLWLEMIVLTLGILAVALAAALIFVGRITRPLSELAQAAQRLDEGRLDITVRHRGEDEVGTLAASFNGMIARIRDFTVRLEEKTAELERSHEQTRVFCEIVREIGSLGSLHEVCATLIGRIAGILKCRRMALLVPNDGRERVYVVSEKSLKVVEDHEHVRRYFSLLDELDGTVPSAKRVFSPPLVPDFFKSAPRQSVIPFGDEHEMRGALAVACPDRCERNLREIDWIALILTQSAGVIRRAVLQEEAGNDFHQRTAGRSRFRGLIGKDPKMRMIYQLIEDIAPTDATVLIQGESGTGKEIVARAIHLESDRKDGKFVVINCSAYPDTLLESELFGHEKGAFTGAVGRRIGRFEQADGGTVFLDEIGEISPQAQIKLLRVIQSRTFERLGGNEPVSVNVRVIAATNKDLAQQAEKGRFREDLFFRLNVIPISLPRLRDRRNDIPALANHFLRHFAEEQDKDVEGFGSDAMRLVLGYNWPGNVRELENSVEHAVVLAKGKRIETRDLPPVLSRGLDARGPARGGMSVMEESEKAAVERALEECGWNRKRAAIRLGIGRTTLYAKLKKYGITKPLIQ